MTQIKLSKRLAAIARLIPEGVSAVDVGTDHGYIPVWLCQRGKNFPVYAADINSEPLQRAALSAREYGLEDKICLVLCDGLAAFRGDEADCIIIAGMGGETIISILSAAPWTRQTGKTLVLQPMTKAPELRRWLYENGYAVTHEELVEDGHIYELLTVRAGQDEPYSPVEPEIGHFELISGDPLLERRLDELIEKHTRALCGLSRSSVGGRDERASELKMLCSGLSELKARLGRTT